MSGQLSLFLAKDPASAWNVRESRRARRLSVRVYPAGRVEVIVPLRTPAMSVQQFVSRHREWIEQRLRECTAAESLNTLPHALELRAIGKHVRVEASTGAATRVRQSQAGVVRLSGNLSDAAAWSSALRRWLATFAQAEIDRCLSQLSAQTGLEYKRLQIRRQRTRWGSCSSRGSISINVCALFLEPRVLRYLLIHELCHTRHMNHSKRFWSLVEAIEPDYAQLDRELSRGWRHVPAWMFFS